MSQAQRLLRAAAVGLGAAFLVAGVWVLVLAGQRLATPVDCERLGPESCELESTIRQAEIRLYLPEGAALVMLAVALGLWLRKSNTEGEKNR